MRLIVEINAQGVKNGENRFLVNYVLTPHSFVFQGHAYENKMFEDIDYPTNSYEGFSQSEQIRIYENLKEKLESCLKDYFSSIPIRERSSVEGEKAFNELGLEIN